MKGSGVSGFVCLVELQIVHIERNRVTGYWILADMSNGRECTVSGSGTFMEGSVLLQAVAQLWKGVYCCRQWHTSTHHKQAGNKNATLGYNCHHCFEEIKSF